MNYSAMRGVSIVETLADDTAFIISMVDQPIPATAWVRLLAADITGTTSITVSYSLDNGANYITIAVVTTATWEVTFDSGITHLKFQRTAGTGETSTCGVC